MRIESLGGFGVFFELLSPGYVIRTGVPGCSWIALGVLLGMVGYQLPGQAPVDPRSPPTTGLESFLNQSCVPRESLLCHRET